MPSNKTKVTEPSWLVHLHYGKEGIPLTVYDNHDGTFTYADDKYWLKNADAEGVLRVFASKVNELALSNTKLKG